jgi:hypothetical protein
MDDLGLTDHYLSRTLKNWVACFQAPRSSRSQLLWAASRASETSRPRNRKRRNVITSKYQPMDWSHTLCSWSIMHSFRNGITVSRLLI